MISSAELASTGSSPGTARLISVSKSAAASAMRAAGRACSPTAEPTLTVWVGMVSPRGGCRVEQGKRSWPWCLSGSHAGEVLNLLALAGHRLQQGHGRGGDHR